MGTVTDPFRRYGFQSPYWRRRASGYTGALVSLKNKKANAMLKQPKFRQAGLILFATTVVLILPNLSRLFG